MYPGIAASCAGFPQESRTSPNSVVHSNRKSALRAIRREDADVGEIAVALGIIHPIAHDEVVRNAKSNIVGFDRFELLLIVDSSKARRPYSD